MKIRIKFAKYGPVKFVGHLDMLRYFQKLVRRAEIDICYSAGFSPHQIMSFAAPLGVGMQGFGEYTDIEVHSTKSSKESLLSLNRSSVEGVDVLRYIALPENTPNAMSSVAAADYFVTEREGYETEPALFEKFREFMALPEILIEKETKKSSAIIDIRPMIYDMECVEDGENLGIHPMAGKTGIFLKLATGSVNNLKPELVLKAFYQYLNREFPVFAYSVSRLEVYGNAGSEAKPDLKPLDFFGEEIL